MTEARAIGLGQYAHNNQPAHHLLFLFALLGDRETTEVTVRYILRHSYGPDFYCGDEDNGEMASWYVLSALGLYPVVLGTPDYVLVSPIFKHVRVYRVDGYDSSTHTTEFRKPDLEGHPDSDINCLDIVALGTDASHFRVAKVLMNENEGTRQSSVHL
jgi:hypothetical protein